jgi:hypothetical protein
VIADVRQQHFFYRKLPFSSKTSQAKKDQPKMKFQQREQNKLPIKRVIMLWMPFAFSAFLAAITLAPTFFGISDPMPPGLFGFIYVLPMAFFFTATATFTEISTLEARIKELENK